MLKSFLSEYDQDRNIDEDNNDANTNFSSDDSCGLKKQLDYTPPTLALPADEDSYYLDSEGRQAEDIFPCNEQNVSFKQD